MEVNNKLNRKSILRYCLMGFLIFALFVCFVTSAIVLPVICTNRIKVASAADATVVDSFQSQAGSDYTLKNISTYPRLFGVFFDKSFNLSYAECEAKNSYFKPLGADDAIEIKFTSTASSSLYTRSFAINPVVITNDVITSLGGDFTLRFPVYSLSVTVIKNGEDYFGDRYNFLIHNDITDVNKLSTWTYNQVFGFTNPIPVLFDFNSIPKSGDASITYGDFVPSLTGMTAEMLDFWSNYIYLSLPSGAPAAPSEEDLTNAYNSGYSNGVSDYLYNSGLVYPLNVDSYVSLGCFSVNNGTESYEVLTAKSVENHTNNNSSTVDIYSFMPYGINGNLIFTQGNPPTIDSDFTGTAGYYGVKSSFATNGVSNVIKAGTPFSLDMAFARSSSNRISGVFTNVDYTILFLDKSMNPIYYNATSSGDYYINNTILGMDSASNGKLLSDVLTSGDVHFYNFPVDVYGIMILSYHKANEFAHSYSLTARYLGDAESQQAYDTGFNAGVNSINKNDIFNQGYTKGFSEGSAEGSNYTFMSLLGAVIDAPISAFTGMFDFTLLGVNLRSFILAMLTLAIVIVLIRIALGGK